MGIQYKTDSLLQGNASAFLGGNAAFHFLSLGKPSVDQVNRREGEPGFFQGRSRIAEIGPQLHVGP